MAHVNIANWTRADYERAAEEYLQSLPPEHFMEATPQGTQREITLASLAVLQVYRPEVQHFNELLVQQPINDHLVQVCPDNMVVLSTEPLGHMGSFNTPFEEVKPFWVLEYVSSSSKRKDYIDNMRKYQDELKVPYYLLFYPEKQDLRLYQHNGVGFDRVEPNSKERLVLAELDLEIGLLDGWARFWYRGELLPLPADLVLHAIELRSRLEAAERLAKQEGERAEKEKGRAEKEKERAEKEKERAEKEKERAEKEKERAEKEKERAEKEKANADKEKENAGKEKERADKAEMDNARLQALLAQLQGQTPSQGPA
jgi:Uma2 family endonuclease